MKDRAKLKGITYKARTVRPVPTQEIAAYVKGMTDTPLPACYGQPDCQCMHCQQSRAGVEAGVIVLEGQKES